MDNKQQNFVSKISETEIDGLYTVESLMKGDLRGGFREVARIGELETVSGRTFEAKQINHSSSIYGSLRGIHVEPWNKIVTVASGLAMCLLLDCRKNSKTYGKMKSIFLGFGKLPDGRELNGGSIFVPAGVGNSFLVLSERLEYVYVVDGLWNEKTSIYAVNPMDPKLAINWTDYVPNEKIIRSERDINSPSFEEFGEKIQDF